MKNSEIDNLKQELEFKNINRSINNEEFHKSNSIE